MFLGIPPISTYAGGVEEVITDGKTGFLLNYGDEAKLAELLAKLYQNPALRIQMGKQARQTVAPMFSLDRLQDEIVSFCNASDRKTVMKGV